MSAKMMLSVLLLSTACASPAFANYFSNRYLNINLNIGSAPNPTPRDVRENRLPQVSHAAPSGGNVVADDTTKNAANPTAIDHAGAQAAEGKKASAPHLSR
jgi:hypothetical protein